MQIEGGQCTACSFESEIRDRLARKEGPPRHGLCSAARETKDGGRRVRLMDPSAPFGKKGSAILQRRSKVMRVQFSALNCPAIRHAPPVAA